MKYIATLLVAFMLLGCAGMGLNPTDLKTPHARGRFVVKTYNLAYLDHVRYSQMENLTDNAKQLLNAKRRILIEMGSPLGPIPAFINYIETGTPITDAMFNMLLDRLLMLETGWYTNDAQYIAEKPQVFQLTPQSVFKASPDHQTEENLNRILTQFSQQAKIVPSGPEAQLSGMEIGVLIELLRAGIHAIRVMWEQREMDEVALGVAYNEAVTQFRSLDPNALVEF